MTKKTVMVIPVIKNTVSWEQWQGIKHYTYRPDEIHVITNETLGLTNEHTPQGGSRKIPVAFDKFKPDILIYHASDWLLDETGLMDIMAFMQDPMVISAGIHPYTRNGGSWHICSKDETPHACQYIVAYKKEIMDFVNKLMKANYTGELLNEACYYATLAGWEVRPIHAHAWNTGRH